MHPNGIYKPPVPKLRFSHPSCIKPLFGDWRKPKGRREPRDRRQVEPTQDNESKSDDGFLDAEIPRGRRGESP